MTMWGRKGRKAHQSKGSPLTISEVITNVMHPVHQQWKELGIKLRQGNILFSEFNRYFQRKDNTYIKDELSIMSPDNDTVWVFERVEQFRQHTTLRRCLNGAKVILEVVKRYELQGNFDKIKRIVDLVSMVRL